MSKAHKSEKYIYKSVYMYFMNHLVNLAHDVYVELTRRKEMHKASYSEVIREMLRTSEPQKIYTIKTMIENQKARDAKFKGKTEKIDYDLILYGVSRDAKSRDTK